MDENGIFDRCILAQGPDGGVCVTPYGRARVDRVPARGHVNVPR
jgi:hypothetical protein